jgi:protein gp37
MMADGTHIEWTDASWNPVRARDKETGRVGWFCTHASEGCRFCYAETFNHRLGTGIAYQAQNRDRIEIFIDEKILAQPLHWRQPRRIFTLSMSDLFGEFVTDAMIDRVFAVMALAPTHTFQVLTKRAARMRQYIAELGAEHWLPQRLQDAATFIPAPNLQDDEPPEWLGVSVEDQARTDERIPALLATPAAKRFISAEPLLSGIDMGWALSRNPIEIASGFLVRGRFSPGMETLRGIDWVIAGGESGPGARPMHPDWARSLRDQCTAAEVPFFFKQWGRFRPGSSGRSLAPDGSSPGPDRWSDPSTAWMETVGKKAAGRLLDGREWSEFPA